MDVNIWLVVIWQPANANIPQAESYLVMRHAEYWPSSYLAASGNIINEIAKWPATTCVVKPHGIPPLVFT
jgi:hypothetical protein